MTETRIKFSNIVKNQLPEYVRDEFPLISEFLSQYYISQEFKGAPLDLIQNIDRYIKIDQQTDIINSVSLKSNVSFLDDVIFVNDYSETGTEGFPDSYGLIQIDDEIITYTSKTADSFVGCIRGFSGVTSLETQNKPDQLTFSTSEASDHTEGSKVINLSNLFLIEFLRKVKYQLLPGLEDRTLYSDINQKLFIKQAKDFYRSKGTDESFTILFRALYGENVSILKPKEQMISPSNALYSITNNFVVEAVSGDPSKLINQTLYQDEYGNIQSAYAPITDVKKIVSSLGETYYNISVDSGYDRDLRVEGAVYGNFSVHPKTRVIGQVSAGSSIIDVDSTVSFPNSGELYVSYNDNTTGIVSYTSKSLTQFFDCSNITGTILDASSVGINTYAYANVVVNGETETIRVRINSVLSGIEVIDESFNTVKGDLIQIKTLGTSDSNDFKSNNWVFNTAQSYKVNSIAIENSSNNTYRLTLKKEHSLKKGDLISISDSSSNEQLSTVVKVNSKNSISISGQGQLSLTNTYSIKKRLSKVNSAKFTKLSNLSTNVQNVYKDGSDILVASPSLPSYYNQSLETHDYTVVFSGIFPPVGVATTDTFQITTNTDHGFYTGDKVYYTPEKSVLSQILPDDLAELNSTVSVVSSLFDEGIYYVQRVDSTRIKFAKSNSDIKNNNFITIEGQRNINNNQVQLYPAKIKSLSSQKLLRQISNPINDGFLYDTPVGKTGILINGVEILNYKSSDAVYYGNIEKINVTSSGFGYDVINPPTLKISDEVGTGATGICGVAGNLVEIRIIDSGFDYVETPSIKITGGNGRNAKASAIMKSISHEVQFNSESLSFVGIGSTLSTIGFSTYHKFRNAEKVIYETNSQQGISGLTTSSLYYVNVVDSQKVKLHLNESDAISGINTVTLSQTGKGVHKLRSYNQKLVLGSINVEDPGFGYQNKRRITTSSGISTSANTVFIKDHQFTSGELITYTTDGTPIGGLISGSNYYVSKVDEDNFRLSEVGIAVSEFYYNTNQYINFATSGSGTHTFNYPEINVEVIGRVGISSIGSEDFKAKVQPIFRGEILSVQVTNGGSQYGSSEILNFDRQPNITVESGTAAQITPIVSSGGQIIDVLINSVGKGYNSPPNLIVNGTGYGAVLTPIISNGQIQSVKIIEGGINYSQGTTTISVIPAGQSASFRAQIKKWTVNLFEKYFNNFKGDDGILSEGIDSEYGLQYNHLYAPRNLRDIVYPTDQNGVTIYSQSDLDSDFGQVRLFHSPIIGWAYDGNPIYGPYGYSRKDGGVITQLKSGYSLVEGLNRPNFPLGFFVEDYTYSKTDDESVLDENNGRYCITPEFPNGTYAYFATFESITDTVGPFANHKRPKFPYLLGNNYKSKLIEFNFIPFSNQDKIDLNQTSWVRNTYPYNLIEDSSTYSYVNVPNLLNQTSIIKFASPGVVENVGIVTGGYDFKVNDIVSFDDSDTFGYGLSAKVSRVKGKQVNSISVASTSFSNVEFYQGNSNNTISAVFQNPPNFSNQDTVNVSGLTTTSSKLEGSYVVGLTTNTLSLASSVSDSSVTGIVTYFNVFGNLNISENDVFTVKNEKVKVLNVDKVSSRIRVLRGFDGTVGSSHSITEVLYENPRKLTLNYGKVNSNTQYKNNREYYFDPKDSLSLGTVGIGTTIVFSNPGAGLTQVFVPLKSVYLPNHELETGDEVVYSTNNGSPIEVSTGTGSTFIYNQTKLYVAKINGDLIGLSTVRVGLGSTGSFVGIASTQRSLSTLYFVGIGTGEYHSIKTNYNIITGKVSRNLVTVSTAQTHGLINNDTVFVEVNPSISTTITVKYNDYNRRLLINPKSFSSIGVNTSNYTINIQNHGFANGQKLVYNSPSPSGGLQNNKIYYAVVVDENHIKLSNSYYDSTSLYPTIVGITSASTGTLSPVNPPIKSYKNSSVIFDVSDSSLSFTNQSVNYPAFSFDFYLDENFTQPFVSTEENNQFNVRKNGIIGISSNASVTIFVNDLTPEKLYYKLTPINTSISPIEKNEINVDSLVDSNNQLQINDSVYNGQHRISVASTTSFTYSLPLTPESGSYISSTSNSVIEYETNSNSAFGAISKVSISNKGSNYFTLPGISSVVSALGNSSILEVSSSNIGKVDKIAIKDIGFDFPSDHTLRPTASLPQILKVDPLSSFDYIGISSFGRGYLYPPKLIVLDGKTNEVVPDVDIRYNIGDSQVTIYNNTYSLNNVTPVIIPTQNSNGVGISSVTYNSVTKNVILTLSSQFSTLSSFPFSVGDRIIVENINVGITTTGSGYNSSDYNYKLFTVISVDPKIGGSNPTITYSLNGIISDSSVPGNYNPFNSSGRVVPEKYFPTFNPLLKKNEFLVGETVTSDSVSGIVLGWDKKTNNLRVSSKDDYQSGFVVEGTTSGARGIVTNVDSFYSLYNLSPYSRVENGWETNYGFLNDNLQRIQDSDYYQTFSYSIKSRVDYDKWEDVVSTLNHTAGFKKFSDYQLETSLLYNSGIVDGEGNSDKDSLVVGITTNTTSCEILNDIVGVVNLNCVYDFDLVSENALQIGSSLTSDEIIFSTRILTDYFESVGNRVLLIDDISSQFNSFPRSTRFSEVYRFPLSSSRAQKYILFVRDKRFISQRQLLLTTLIHDNRNGYLNQYGRIETTYDMGSFDFGIDGLDGIIYFYPTKSSVNDYDVTVVSYNLSDNISGVGSTNIGGIVDISTDYSTVSMGTTSTIVAISSSFTSSKLLVEVTLDSEKYEFDELSLVHDGSNIQLLDYGQLSTHSLDQYSTSGFGTFHAYYSGSNINLDFIPTVGLGTTAVINTIQISIANTSVSGIGTVDIKHLIIDAKTISIASSTSPVPVVIQEYDDMYETSYNILQVSDITNGYNQMSEFVLIDDDTETYISEFGQIDTSLSESFSGIGTVGVIRSTKTQVTFTPNPNIDVEVKIYSNSLRYQDDSRSTIDFNNASIRTGFGLYFGTERDVKRTFNITNNTFPVFRKSFDGSSSSVVDVTQNTISIPNHFFVTGEEVLYTNPGLGYTMSIGIASTSFAGIGTTDKLPSTVYVVKVNDNLIKLARSAEDSLKFTPNTLNLTSVGIGTSHSFTSINQNSKVLLSIDNVIQSPIVFTAITTKLSTQAFTTDDIIYFTGITSFFGGDLIKIGSEIMRIEGVGIGSTNAIRVRRPWLGTNIAGYSTGTLVTKVVGNYNIVDNTLNFTEAPYGNVPQETDSPDEVDWLGISTSSSFSGRVFLRSGITNSSDETYSKNYIFDDVSEQFNSTRNTFTLKSNRQNIVGFRSDNAIILVNDIFQTPSILNNYTLDENAGISSITFNGVSRVITNDVGISSFPKGGIIVSVGSTSGFGYQPLVSAGGTAVVSIAGTIQFISIGNSGSGYRSGIQTVRVGVATTTVGTPSINFIGTATVSNGNIIGVAITNPGNGYTSTNPPYVIFDSPLSYSNIPLVYSSSSATGFGTQATIDVVVGQGSSVIDFEIKNLGYGYGQGEVLTLPIGGNVGIPTVLGTSFSEFNIVVDQTISDKFTGWTIGQLELLDDISSLFDGVRVVFPITLNGNVLSIRSSAGSNINVENTLLVFINDILQVPGEGYYFPGGSTITFSEAPKSEDTVSILFYKGTGEVDVRFKDVLETVKVGDELTIGYDSSIGQKPILQEESRTVTNINSTNSVDTNTYFGPGNVSDETLLRPVVWCRQTEDKIINETEIGKDRSLYEASFYPSSYLIQPVGVGSTIVYIDNIRPFFNPINEGSNLDFQKNVSFISQKNVVGSYATAVVSSAGTVTSVSIVDGGLGYGLTPTVQIQSPIGFGTTATATASITSGIVTTITVTNSGSGYSQTNPPIVLISPPSPIIEKIQATSFEGDFGIITGISTTTIGIATTALVFDLVIPKDSFLRDSSITGVTTVSGIATGYYFLVYNSNVGNGVTSLNSDGSIIGIGTTFLDNVYQVDSVSIAQTQSVGFGVTYVAKVTVKVSGYNGLSGIGISNFYGEYSWGRVVLSYRDGENDYVAYPTGISTGTLFNRTTPLRSSNYI